MKRVTMNMRNLVNVVLVVILTTVSTVSFASGEKTVKPAKSIPTEVKYLYTVNGNDIIQIDIENENAEDLEITLVDGEGEELYSEMASDKKISKKFLMDMHDFTAKKISLVVTSKKGGINQTMLLTKQALLAKL